MSSKVAESSSTELACSVAPWDRAMPEEATWAEPLDTRAVAAAMPPRVWFSFSLMVRRSSWRALKSPGYWALPPSLVRSPFAMLPSTAPISSSMTLKFCTRWAVESASTLVSSLPFPSGMGLFKSPWDSARRRAAHFTMGPAMERHTKADINITARHRAALTPIWTLLPI